jgi:hypothetical protein
MMRKRNIDLLDDIADGQLQQVSVGYEVYEYEIIGVDEASDLPLFRATRWCPREVSSVAVGDAGAIMRSPRSAETLPVGTGDEPPKIEDGQQQTGDIVYSLDVPAPNVPVDAYALPSVGPRIFQIQNQKAIQR